MLFLLFALAMPLHRTRKKNDNSAFKDKLLIGI